MRADVHILRVADSVGERSRKLMHTLQIAFMLVDRTPSCIVFRRLGLGSNERELSTTLEN